MEADAVAFFNLVQPAVEKLRQTQGSIVALGTSAMARAIRREDARDDPLRILRRQVRRARLDETVDLSAANGSEPLVPPRIQNPRCECPHPPPMLDVVLLTVEELDRTAADPSLRHHLLGQVLRVSDGSTREWIHLDGVAFGERQFANQLVRGNDPSLGSVVPDYVTRLS